MRRTVIGAVVLLLAAAAAYAGWRAIRDDGDSPDEPADPALTAQLQQTGLTLYLPELRDWQLVKTRINPESGYVELKFKTPSGGYAYHLTERPAVDGDLCVKLAYDPAGDCSYADGVMRYTFEEMSVAAVVRGDTLLVAGGLVTEEEPERLDEAVEALQTAPEVSPEELSRAG